MFASGPPSLPHSNGPPVPLPYGNGAVPIMGQMPAVRPPPQSGVFPPMHHAGFPQTWSGQSQQPGQGFPSSMMPPPQVQQFRGPIRPPPPNMPPPPQGVMARPPPAGMGGPPLQWRPMAPPPQQGMMSMPPSQQGGMRSMPPPPPNMQQPSQPTT